jgi:hypothetical protein
MISLLIDAATAAVVVLDRFCTAVGNVRLQTTASPPLSSEGGAPSPGAGDVAQGANVSAAGPGGHPDELATELIGIAATLLAQRDDARAALAEACRIGRWLVAESRWESDVLLTKIFTS